MSNIRTWYLERIPWDYFDLWKLDASEYHAMKREINIDAIYIFFKERSRINAEFHSEYISEWKELLEKLFSDRQIGVLKYLATHDQSILHGYSLEEKRQLQAIKMPIWFQALAWIRVAEYYRDNIPETTNLSQEDNKKTQQYFEEVYTPSIEFWNKTREKYDYPTIDPKINESEAVRTIEWTLNLIHEFFVKNTNNPSWLDTTVAALCAKCYALLHTFWITKKLPQKSHTNVANVERIFEYIAQRGQDGLTWKSKILWKETYAILAEISEMLESHEYYMKRWQRYNKMCRYWEIDSITQKSIQKIAKDEASTSEYLRYYEWTVHAIISTEATNPVIEALNCIKSDIPGDTIDWLLLLQANPDILKYIVSGEINSLRGENFFVPEYCTVEELPVWIKDYASILLYRIYKNFSGLVWDDIIWGNKDDEKKWRQYYKEIYLPYIQYRESAGDTINPTSGWIMASEMTRLFAMRLWDHWNTNAPSNYNNYSFLFLIEIIHHLSELWIDVDYNFGKMEIQANSLSSFVYRMLSNETILSGLRSITIENWVPGDEYCYMIADIIHGREISERWGIHMEESRKEISRIQNNSRHTWWFNIYTWIRQLNGK